MDLRQVRYFIAVADELHFGRAAEALGMAQPPLSQQIQRLERDLGVQLFRRDRRHVELTDAGHTLLTRARPLLADLASAEDLTKRSARGEVGHIGIGFISSVLFSYLPSLLREFHRQAPLVSVSLRDLTSAAMTESLRQHRLDVVFMREPADEEFEHVVVRHETLLIALPEEHPLAKQETVRLREAGNELFMLFPRRLRPDLYDSIVKACQHAGFEPRVVEQDVSPQQVILAFVAAGMGVALVPASYAALRWQGIALRPLEEDVDTLNLAMCWRKGRNSTAVENFVRIVREMAEGEHGGA